MSAKLEPGDLIVCHPDDYPALAALVIAGGLRIKSSEFMPLGKSLHIKAAALELPPWPPLPQTVAAWEDRFTQPAARKWFRALIASGMPTLEAARLVLERLCGMDQPNTE